MYYYAMCGTCPSRTYWYKQSKDKDDVEQWARNHTATFGHGVSLGQAKTPFRP